MYVAFVTMMSLSILFVPTVLILQILVGFGYLEPIVPWDWLNIPFVSIVLIIGLIAWFVKVIGLSFITSTLLDLLKILFKDIIGTIFRWIVALLKMIPIVKHVVFFIETIVKWIANLSLSLYWGVLTLQIVATVAIVYALFLRELSQDELQLIFLAYGFSLFVWHAFLQKNMSHGALANEAQEQLGEVASISSGKGGKSVLLLFRIVFFFFAILSLFSSTVAFVTTIAFSIGLLFAVFIVFQRQLTLKRTARMDVPLKRGIYLVALVGLSYYVVLQQPVVQNPSTVERYEKALVRYPAVEPAMKVADAWMDEWQEEARHTRAAESWRSSDELPEVIDFVIDYVEASLEARRTGNVSLVAPYTTSDTPIASDLASLISSDLAQGVHVAFVDAELIGIQERVLGEYVVRLNNTFQIEGTSNDGVRRFYSTYLVEEDKRTGTLVVVELLDEEEVE